MTTIDTIYLSFLNRISIDKTNYEVITDSLKQGYQNSTHYKKNALEIKKRLDNGWKPEDLLTEIQEFYRQGESTDFIGRLLPEKPLVKTLEANLLSKNEKYTHPDLFNTKPLVLDEDDNIIEQPYVERKSTYKMVDLMEYYLNTLNPDGLDRKYLFTVIKSLLNRNNHIDDLLFGIDLWAMRDNSLGVGKDPWKLAAYIDEAREERKTRSYE